MMKGNYYTPFSLRISEDMHEKLKFIAKDHKRSENKEIEYILEHYIKQYEKENGKINFYDTEN